MNNHFIARTFFHTKIKSAFTNNVILKLHSL